MTKRIVSGIFILTALGALGVILAGALTSGEQLIVRFLTAVIVAALGLYVISDLRLQADDDAMTARSGGHPRLSTVDAPPNSTAAFMATVTKRADRRHGESVEADASREALETIDKAEQQMVGGGTTTSSATERASAAVEDAGSTADPTRGEVPAHPVPAAPESIRATMPPPRGEIGLTELFAARADAESPASGPSSGQPAMPPMPSTLADSMADPDTFGSTTTDTPLDFTGAGIGNPDESGEPSYDGEPDSSLGGTDDLAADNTAAHSLGGEWTTEGRTAEAGEASWMAASGPGREDDAVDRHAVAEQQAPDHDDDSSEQIETLDSDGFLSATPFEEAQLAVAAMNASGAGSDSAAGAPYYGSHLNGAGRNGRPSNGTHLNGSALGTSLPPGQPGLDGTVPPRRLLNSIDIFGEPPRGNDRNDRNDRNDGFDGGETDDNTGSVEVEIEVEVFEPTDTAAYGADRSDDVDRAAGPDPFGDAEGTDGAFEGTGDTEGHRGEPGATADQAPVENVTAMADFQYSDDLQSPIQEWPPVPPEAVEPAPAIHPFEKASAAYQAEKDRLAAAASNTADLPVVARRSEIEAAEYADAPLAPIIDLREVNRQNPGSIDAAIDAGEVEVITTLIEQGMLSTDGPISDRDVRTMVYVAFTSNELRKLLLAGGTPDGPNHGLDLGPVELFDEQIHAPAPKTLYSGLPPQQRQPQSQIG